MLVPLMATMHEPLPYEPSICIPRVEKDVSAHDIRTAFERVLGRSVVESVDLVPWRGQDTMGRRRAFIHLTAWPDTPAGTLIRQRLLLKMCV